MSDGRCEELQAIEFRQPAYVRYLAGRRGWRRGGAHERRTV